MVGNSSLGLPIQNSSVNTEYATAYDSTEQGCVRSNTNIEISLKAIAYFIILVVSLVGNILILLIISKNKQLRKSPINYFVFNMAVSDLFVPLTIIPLSIAFLYESANWFPGGFGVFLCKFLPFLVFISIGSSILTLTVMTVDRYLAIVRTMRRPLSLRLIVLAITSTWLISGLAFGSELYKYNLYNESGQVICAPRWVDDLQASHEITKYEMMFRFVLFYLIPLFSMAVLYSKIVLHMWKRKAPGEYIDKNRQRIEQQNRKVIMMLITVVTIFALCWLPVQVNHFLITYDYYNCLPVSLILTFFFVSHANPAINPCLYLIFNENFRGAFKHQLRIRRNSQGVSVTVSNGTSKTGSQAIGATECHGLLALDVDGARESVV